MKKGRKLKRREVKSKKKEIKRCCHNCIKYDVCHAIYGIWPDVISPLLQIDSIPSSVSDELRKEIQSEASMLVHQFAAKRCSSYLQAESGEENNE